MPTLSRQIAQLEAQIEELSGAAERCRNIMLAGRIAAGSGGVLLLADLLGLLGLQPAMFLASIAAFLAGIVIYGSNRTTLEQIKVTIRDRERRRDQLIDGLGLQAVDDAADRPVNSRASLPPSVSTALLPHPIAPPKERGQQEGERALSLQRAGCCPHGRE